MRQWKEDGALLDEHGRVSRTWPTIAEAIALPLHSSRNALAAVAALAVLVHAAPATRYAGYIGHRQRSTAQKDCDAAIRAVAAATTDKFEGRHGAPARPDRDRPGHCTTPNQIHRGHAGLWHGAEMLLEMLEPLCPRRTVMSEKSHRRSTLYMWGPVLSTTVRRAAHATASCRARPAAGRIT